METGTVISITIAVIGWAASLIGVWTSLNVKITEMDGTIKNLNSRLDTANNNIHRVETSTGHMQSRLDTEVKDIRAFIHSEINTLKKDYLEVILSRLK